MEQDTTIRVYVSDRDWLLNRRRKAGADRPRTPTMADVIRELIETVMDWEERGEPS